MRPIVKAGTGKEPSALELKNRELAKQAAQEGFVLLENDGVLPLKEKKVALYGSGARMTVKGGTGSGAVRERYSVNIEEGLKTAGVEITTTDWLDRFGQFYADTYEEYRQSVEKKVEGVREFYKILGMAGRFEHPTGIPVTEGDIANSGVDTAIYVLARQAGEGEDREDKKGDYRLDDVECKNLRVVSEAYKNFIVVVNAGGVLDLSFMDDLHVSALIYFVQGGEEGGNALGELLVGEKNFSGKLATSWAYEFSDIPSNTTYSYLGEDKHQQEYNEGIYVGYRFFDTFGVKPRYAFGYGLSYTTFDIRAVETKQKGETLQFDVDVTNTGSRTGKEVIQLYVTVPFGTMGNEYQRLAAFAKTKELQPGETQRIILEAGARQLTVYDEKRSVYMLQEGEYVFRLGNVSDKTTAILVMQIPEEKITEQCTRICPVQHEIKEITPPARKAEDLSGVPVLELDTEKIWTVTHTYETTRAAGEDKLQKLVDSMSVKQLATLVCGGGTSAQNLVVQAMGASGTTTAELYEELGIPNVILSDGPAGLNLTCQIVEMGDGTYRAAKVPQVLEAYRRYMFGFSGAAMRSQMADPSEGVVHYQYATAWPCSQLLAQSFNTELLKQVGDAVGAEMEAFGVTIWLAPGMNIHRNPLCGRTFEYYSEDPYVSGKMAAAIVCGVQSHPGKGTSVKHFVANNCELERNSSSSNMTERTLRELYLKGFEIVVKEAAPVTVMASYNLVNGVYAVNNYDLLVKVLRNEWGFEGLVMSDWDSMKADREDCTKAVTGDVQKAPGAQLDLIMPGRPDQVEALLKGVADRKVAVEDLKRSAVRILKMVSENTVRPMDIG